MSRFLVPLGFIVLVIFLGVGLKLDPKEIPSPFIGKPAPAFNLVSLRDANKMIKPADYKGQVWLLNVWATWCVACRAEHHYLVSISKQNTLPIIGLNYKDESALAIRWLEQLGNPYEAVAIDADGDVGINYGVYGTPETFLIDKKGIIRYKNIGPITPQSWQQKILPLVQQLNGEAG